MSTHHLPESIEPLLLAAQGTRLQGSIDLADLPRLGDLLQTKEGKIKVDLQFGLDADQIAFIAGTIKTELVMLCQRCLHPVSVPLEVKLSLSPIKDAALAKNLPGTYEALMITDEPTLLRGVIEDELLLNIPLVAKHDEKECAIKLQNSSKKSDNSTFSKPNPFNILKKYKFK